jgi:hypothetical protein
MLDGEKSMVKISGKIDLFGEEGNSLPINMGDFDFQDIAGILKSKREGALKRDAKVKPLLPERLSDYVSIFIDSARNESQLIPCLLLAGCVASDQTREPSFDLVASVQIDQVKETLSNLISKVFVKFMNVLSIRQRPNTLETKIMVSSLNLSPVINGVPILSVSTEPFNVQLLSKISLSMESGLAVKFDKDLIDPILREYIKIGLIPDSVPQIGVLLKDLSIVDFFVNQNGFQKSEKSFYFSMLPSTNPTLLSQSLSMVVGEQLMSSSSVGKNLTNATTKSILIHGTSHQVLSLDIPLKWVPSAFIPAIYLNSISIEIYYKGFRIIEVSFPRFQGVLTLEESRIRINGFKSTDNPDQQQAFNDLLYLMALRQVKFHIDIKVSKVLRNMEKVTIFDHQIQFPPVTKPTNFVKSITPGFQSSIGWSPKVDITFNNMLDWDMYVTKLELDLFHWSDLQKWRDMRSLNDPNFITGSKRYTPKCEQENNLDYWRRQCAFEDRATEDPLLFLKPLDQGKITLPLKWGGTLMALKDAVGKCMSVNGSIAVAFRFSNESSFVSDLRLKIPYQGIGKQCLQFERTKCYPMLQSPENGKSKYPCLKYIN